MKNPKPEELTQRHSVPSTEVLFALRPLQRSLFFGYVQAIVESNGEDDVIEAQFSNVDAESYALKYLADVDKLLSRDYLSTMGVTASPHEIPAVSELRIQLAAAISQGLDYVLEQAPPVCSLREPRQRDLELARELSRQALLEGLAEGYRATAITKTGDAMTVLDFSDFSHLSGPPSRDCEKPTVLIADSPLKIPQRGYPPVATLVSQSAVQTHEHPTDWREVLMWNYVLVYQYEFGFVDQLRLKIDFSFDTGRSSVKPPIALRSDLVTALLRYSLIAGHLWENIEQELLRQRGEAIAPGPAMDSIVRAFREVADAWSEHWNAVPDRLENAEPEPQPQGTCLIQTVSTYYDSERDTYYYDSVRLFSDGANEESRWPMLSAQNSDRQFVELGGGIDKSGGREYKFPFRLEAGGTLDLQLTLGPLPVSTYTNAAARVQTLRNADLSDVVPTNPAFVYEGDWMKFPNTLVPCVTGSRPNAFDIGRWDWDPSNNPLNAVFEGFLGPDTGKWSVNINLSYEYELQDIRGPGSDAALSGRIPVALLQAAILEPTTVESIVSAASHWNETTRPRSCHGERWLLDVAFFSPSIPGLPLLKLLLISGF